MNANPTRPDPTDQQAQVLADLSNPVFAGPEKFRLNHVSPLVQRLYDEGHEGKSIFYNSDARNYIQTQLGVPLTAEQLAALDTQVFLAGSVRTKRINAVAEQKILDQGWQRLTVTLAENAAKRTGLLFLKLRAGELSWGRGEEFKGRLLQDAEGFWYAMRAGNSRRGYHIAKHQDWLDTDERRLYVKGLPQPVAPPDSLLLRARALQLQLILELELARLNR